jgi:predicted MPP superfamily phosphohydrolase
MSALFAFRTFTFLAYLLTIGWAARVRGKWIARFLTIVLGFHVALSGALAMAPGLPWPLLFWLQGALFLHFSAMAAGVFARGPWRWLVAIPASAMGAYWWLVLPIVGTFRLFEWLHWQALGRWPSGFDLWGLGVVGQSESAPWRIAAGLTLIGVAQSLWTRETTVRIELEADVLKARPVEGHKPVRWRMRGPQRKNLGSSVRGEQSDGRVLRLVQITDPHLGTFMPVDRLQRICQRAVDRDPDLILLTGDFLTFESQRKSDWLVTALAPLRAAPGKCFACLGNHDHETRQLVESALREVGVQLLVDEMITVATAVGPVEVLGAEFYYRGRDQALGALAQKHPRGEQPLRPRLLLLHDPTAFQFVPQGMADLVLSGHTHGGQLGFVSLGLPWTFLSLTGLPDHGMWAHGVNRLYVHRGTGHYGFPIRLGVPAEQSLLELRWI